MFMTHFGRYFIFVWMLVFSCSMVIKAQTTSADFVHQTSVTTDLKAPSRIAINTSGIVFVADDFTKQIKKFDNSSNYLGMFDYIGQAVSLAFSDANILFVGDGENNKITRIDADGNQTVIYSGVIFPSDMVTSPDNLLYVVDGITNKVLVMDFGGNIIRTIGSGILLAPRCIAFDRQNNRIIVSEHGGVGTSFNLHAEIRIFDLIGTLISTFGGYGNTDGKFYRIQGMTIGQCGNIYVSDDFQGAISVFISPELLGIYINPDEIEQ